jgi:hypothetical protein
MWEQMQHVAEGVFHHSTGAVAKMLWYDDIDHDWAISKINNRLDYKVGEINLLHILRPHETKPWQTKNRSRGAVAETKDTSLNQPGRLHQ